MLNLLISSVVLFQTALTPDQQEVWSEVTSKFAKGKALICKVAVTEGKATSTITINAKKPNELTYVKGKQRIRTNGKTLTFVDDVKHTLDKMDYSSDRPFGMTVSAFGVIGQYDPAGMYIFEAYGVESFFFGKDVLKPLSAQTESFMGGDALAYTLSTTTSEVVLYIDIDRRIPLGWKKTVTANAPSGREGKVTEGKYEEITLDGATIGPSKYSTQRERLEEEAGKTTVGSRLPNLSFKDLSGKSVNLSSLAKQHKLLLVNFWHLGCPPCREEMPILNEFAKELSKKGVYAITVDMHDAKAADIKSFLDAKNLTVPTFMAYDQWDSVMKACGIVNYPTILLLDQKLVIRQKLNFLQKENILTMADAIL